MKATFNFLTIKVQSIKNNELKLKYVKSHYLD